MAKTGVSDKDPTHDNLKKELLKLVKAILEESPSSELEDDNGFVENVDRVIQILQALIDFKKSGKQLSNSSIGFCPQEFICPLSKDVMKDPVIISTGTTYDRSSILKWIKVGNRTCPVTQQLLTSPNLTSNHWVRDMIMRWCKNRGVECPTPEFIWNREALTEADHELLLTLFTNLSSPDLAQQKEAGRALRSLTKRLPAFRAYFSESIESVPQLLTPFTQSEIDPILQHDLIATLMYLSTHETNKKIVAETPMVVQILMMSLRSGTMETRSNAAAALSTLSTLDSNKTLIGKAGALRPLIDLLEEGPSFVMKDVGSAIYNLCINNLDNKGRAVENRGVSVILKKIQDRVHVDQMVAILAMLSRHYDAVVEMAEHGAVSCMFSFIKETNCERNKENCIAVVYRICLKVVSKWKEMWIEESHYRTISKIADTGSLRAKRKAKGIIDRIHPRSQIL